MSDVDQTNKVVIETGKRIAVAGVRWTIRRDDANCHFIDALTEARQANGIIYLSFASTSIDGNNEGTLDVVSRIRVDLSMAQVLHNLVGQMINDALKPADTSKAN